MLSYEMKNKKFCIVKAKVSPSGLKRSIWAKTSNISAMGHNQKIKWLMCIASVITFIYLLYCTYETGKTFHHWIKYNEAIASPPIVYELHVTHNSSPEHAVPLGPYTSLAAVKGTKTLLISAYLEHRTDEKQVRVIAVVLRRENVAYRCLFRCQEKQLLSNGSASIHRDHFGFAYGTADIMCPLPSGCETPSSIAVTSAAANTTDDPNQEFLEVKNQQEKTESFPYNFTVCISTMFDFTNVLQLVQSLEMLQLLGVNRVVVYKTSCSPETQRILDYYTHKGLVEVIPWSLSRYVNVSRSWLPSHGPGELHYFGQIPALNDCLYRYMYQSRYVALHDIDELILPQNVTSWVELLPLLEKKYGANKCYRFENDVFPINFTFSPPASQSLPPQADWKNVPGVNILAHLYKEPVFIETRMNFKIIVNPRVVFSTSVHGVLKSQHGWSWIDRNIARMYHTRSPRQIHLTKEKLIYDGRLLNYSTHFTPAVNKVLRDTGLLPSTNSL
ncbi:uncharacterized protein LOC116321812 isoform X2 [Oreochromis aureus]|uniref:uncharacterized protein LOC116321812 isoform X1 n=2 Tax=Oreochromis aureus TaxID=47969 RepID=UPI0019535211|nr:uncharacterized protein LOC116321812 isoform X1 [Oreochromis aureus]XP_039454199.1 uncharacterized protein LOC116321812 isoform X2 [Oreochromis aureus]